MNINDILYCGDTSLEGAASYLAGLMTRFGLKFDYLRSDQPLSDEMVSQPRRLFIFSDYPSRLISGAAQQRVLDQVQNGAGLLMIGGWESFHGLGGDWETTAIARALPVEIAKEDDRVNCDQPALLLRSQEHEILADMPWNVRPPTIGGFNRVMAKPQAAPIVLAQQFAAVFENGRFEFTPLEQHPLLVLGAHGSGRTAALMTDVAPHWVGGLVDWGEGERVKAQSAGGGEIEVGNLYAQFIVNLLVWTGQFPRRPA